MGAWSSPQLWEMVCLRIEGELEAISIKLRCAQWSPHWLWCFPSVSQGRGCAWLSQGLSQFKQGGLYEWIKSKCLIFHLFLRLKCCVCAHVNIHTF